MTRFRAIRAVGAAKHALPFAKWALVLCAVLISGWTSCFFDPRDPELGAPPVTRWKPANDPGILMNNVKVTFEDRQIDFYMRSFLADSFSFRADPLDSIDEALQGQNLFADWEVEDERRAAEKIFNEADSITVALSDLSPPDSVSDAGGVRVRKDYELAIITAESTGTSTVIYKGTLTFFMRQSGEWSLVRWEDARVSEPGILSWGKLRAINGI